MKQCHKMKAKFQKEKGRKSENVSTDKSDQHDDQHDDQLDETSLTQFNLVADQE
jgi:hypothetical protein